MIDALLVTCVSALNNLTPCAVHCSLDAILQLFNGNAAFTLFLGNSRTICNMCLLTYN
jgi:hypothetical protein